jgi:PAS domain S-box-containing protein
VNQAIVRARDQGRIFRDLCRIAVAHGLYQAAWVGIVEPGSSRLRCEAIAGLPDEPPSWLDQALQTPVYQEEVVCNNLMDSGCRLPWRTQAASHGYGSAAILPIVAEGKPVGALALCAAASGAFDRENLELLREITVDVGFSLENLHRDALRRQAEQALQDSEERFRQMADNIHEVFWMADAGSGKLLYVSPAYERLWGQSHEIALSAAGALEFLHPGDREIAARVSRTLLAHQAHQYEFHLMRRDGSTRWILNRAFPVPDTSGRVYRFAGIASDVTERKEAAVALQAHVEQHRALAELGQRAIENTSLETFLAATVSRMAEVLRVECCKVLELLPGGQGLLLRAGVGWKEGAVGNLRIPSNANSQAGYTLLSSKPVIVTDFHHETRFLIPDLLRDHNILSGISVVIGDPQNPFGVLGAHSTRPRLFTEDDVHFLQSVASLLAATIRRKQAEDEIQRLNQDLELRVLDRTEELARLNRELDARNQEVERANRLKSEFLATMSHELRTPLNSVIGFTQLLTRQKAGPLNNKQEEFLKYIDDAARHLLQLINDILDVSRIEAGRIELNPEHFEIVESLDEVLSVIRPLAGLKHLELAAVVPSGVHVFADRIRFKQVLYNLLSNAVKFTPEGGRVWIECAAEEMGIRLVVADTGVGIPLEEQEAIFDQFHQVGVSSKGVREGAGLGLSITRRLVELHQGKIAVESRPGAGSRFSLTFPKPSTAKRGSP